KTYRPLVWQLSLANGMIALLFLPQLTQALSRTSAYFGGVAWQGTPHPLSPLTTIYYLLFAHRTPVWLVPMALFLTLALLLLTLWEARRRSGKSKQYEVALWFSIVMPIIIVITLSWLIRPVYLERSFAISAPALILLLARGLHAAPRKSPTPYLAGLLGICIVVTLGISWVTEDPAKPPVRQAVDIMKMNFATGDASLHLHDSSFMPAAWYAPNIEHLLVDVPASAFTIVETHRLFGGDVVNWSAAVANSDRLWLMVLPKFTGTQQNAIHQRIAEKYPQVMVHDWGTVQLYLYDLQGAQ
ncbi:MAG: hypothetical protein AAF629_32265, partial [Chloroflexota bacterium]